MTEETKTVITAGLLLFALAAWFWPLFLAVHLEAGDRKKRGNRQGMTRDRKSRG